MATNQIEQNHGETANPPRKKRCLHRGLRPERASDEGDLEAPHCDDQVSYKNHKAGRADADIEGLPRSSTLATAHNINIQRDAMTTEPAFVCRWKHCQAQFYNLETLKQHLTALHCAPVRLAAAPGLTWYECRWTGCHKLLSKSRSSATTSPMRFETQNEWHEHLWHEHVAAIAWQPGDGPIYTAHQPELGETETTNTSLKYPSADTLQRAVDSQEFASQREARVNTSTHHGLHVGHKMLLIDDEDFAETLEASD